MSPFCVFLALALVVAPALASVEYTNVAPGIQRVIHRHKLMAAGPTELLLGLDLSAAGNLTLSHLSESGVQPGSYIRKPPPFIETYIATPTNGWSYKCPIGVGCNGFGRYTANVPKGAYKFLLYELALNASDTAAADGSYGYVEAQFEFTVLYNLSISLGADADACWYNTYFTPSGVPPM